MTNKVIIGIALLFTVAGLFNTVNRTMVIGLFFLLGGYVFLEMYIVYTRKGGLTI